VKNVLIIIIMLHGLIHLMGFVKAFGIAEISEITLSISRGWGILWLIASLTLFLSGVLWLLNLSSWWIPAIIGVILSQILVFAFWQDARFGSIPNLIILIFIISGFVRHTPPVSMMAEGFAEAPFEERYGEIATGDFRQIINPFHIEIEPMERLLLINIENDPDRLYIGFEPQVFDDEKTGTGILVIAWRVDGKVDVYHQPSLTLDPSGYDIAGKGLENMVSRVMEGAFFEVNERGAQADVSFEDIEGRLIELKLTERSTRKRKPFGLLAPMGVAAENPSAMPLILLHDFCFVRRSNTELIVTIDGRDHSPDNLPLPLDFSRMTFARYCPDPLITKLNPAFDGELSAIAFNEELTLQHDDHIIELTMNQNLPEIRSISRSHNRHTLSLTFDPAFPNLEAFTGEAAEGRFEILGDTSTGLIRGMYRVVGHDEQLEIEMVPSEGWLPYASKLSLRFLYSVQPMFKQWSTTYRWTACLNKDKSGVIRMNSSWERINREGHHIKSQDKQNNGD
jgi:hypothetical protein